MHRLTCVGVNRIQADAKIRWRCPTNFGRSDWKAHLDTHPAIDLVHYTMQCIENRRNMRIIPRGAIKFQEKLPKLKVILTVGLRIKEKITLMQITLLVGLQI